MGAPSFGQVTVVEVALTDDRVDEARETFADLFMAEEAYVIRALRRMGVQPGDVEDMAHEVFLTVHRKIAELDGERPVRPWLFAFCFRVAANYRRAARRTNARSPVDELEDLSPRSDTLLEQDDDRRLVLTALATIDLDRRAVFVMHCLDEIPVPEVAQALGIPLGTAYTRLRAAKKLFVDEIRRLERDRGAR